MRVAHIVPLLFGPRGIYGGAERYAYELALATSEWFKTKLITFGQNPSEWKDGKLAIKVIRPFSYPRQSHLTTKTNPLSVLPLISSIANADLVFCHQQKVLVSTIAASWCRLRRIPVFAIPMGGSGWDVSSYISTDRLFTGILHISKYSLQLNRHQSLPGGHVIYAGVSQSKWFPDPQRRKDGSVLFVGRFLPHKGIDALIKALPVDIPCNIVGTPKNTEYYKELQRLAQGKQVRFLHQVNDDDLRGLYQRAMCVALPSVYTDMYGNFVPWTELLGQTIIEGMACGTAGIATNLAAFPEIIEQGRNGFLYQEGDIESLRASLAQLRDNPGLARAMGEEGLATVREKFTWDVVIDRCLAILRKNRRVAVAR